LVSSYNLWPEDGAGLFSKEKYVRDKISKEKSEEKRISRETNDIYIAPKSTNE